MTESEEAVEDLKLGISDVRDIKNTHETKTYCYVYDPFYIINFRDMDEISRHHLMYIVKV